MTNQSLKRLCPGLLALLLAGCASTPPSRLYLLHAPSDIAITMQYHEHLQDKRISVAPIRIPKHLDRPLIITQQSDVELAYSEFHRWSEPLADNLAEVVVQDLGTLLPGSIIWNARAMSEVDVDYRIHIQVLSLMGNLGEKVELSARWSVFTGSDTKLIQTAISRHDLPLSDASYATYVDAVSQLTLQLSGDIARALQTGP